jgi:predicted acetyltransferase
MSDSNDVAIEQATSRDANLLSNLLELYIHELSGAFPHLEVGEDGRFGYRRLPLYWSEPESRFAFVIKWQGRIAGFAFATRGSPASDDPSTLDVAEFFVLRQYRRRGVGSHGAHLLWKRLPGRWTVRASSGLPSAVDFWRRTVSDVAEGDLDWVLRQQPR